MGLAVLQVVTLVILAFLALQFNHKLVQIHPPPQVTIGEVSTHVPTSHGMGNGSVVIGRPVQVQATPASVCHVAGGRKSAPPNAIEDDPAKASSNRRPPSRFDSPPC